MWEWERIAKETWSLGAASPWKTVSLLTRRLRMLMGIPLLPVSLNAQDNNLLVQVWLWPSHSSYFSPLILNCKKGMTPCSVCSLSAALTAEPKASIEVLGHLLDLQIFGCVKKCSVLPSPVFAGATTKGLDPLPQFLSEKTCKQNPQRAEYAFQSIGFNDIIHTGLGEPAQHGAHLSFTSREDSAHCHIHSLAGLPASVAPLGTCLSEWVALADHPEQHLQFSSLAITHGSWDGEWQEGKKYLMMKSALSFFSSEDRTFCCLLFFYSPVGFSPEQEKNNCSSYRQSYTTLL